MLRLEENHTDVEFINPEIIHVELKESATLSHHLLRELRVFSKVNHGVEASSCIVSNNHTKNGGTSACRICIKAARMSHDMKIALVCDETSLSKAATCPFAPKELNASKIFSHYSDALTWISSKN